MCAGFLCPKCDNLACLHTRPDQNVLHLKRWFFLPKSTSPVSRSQAHFAKRKRIGKSIGFNSQTNWTLYGVIPRSSCKIRLNDVSEMLNYWKRWWIDVDGAFCHSSNILGCTHCFCLFTLWFIDVDASFFHFFHKITNRRSSVAIFHSVVQA